MSGCGLFEAHLATLAVILSTPSVGRATANAIVSSDDIIFVKLYCFFYDTCGYDDIALVQPQYLFCLAIFRIAIKAANIIKGNMHPVNNPT